MYNTPQYTKQYIGTEKYVFHLYVYFTIHNCNKKRNFEVHEKKGKFPVPFFISVSSSLPSSHILRVMWM